MGDDGCSSDFVERSIQGQRWEEVHRSCVRLGKRSRKGGGRGGGD